MAIAPILQWLSDSNRTYHHGKLLYERYGNDVVTKTIIGTGHQGSSYHFNILENALKELSSKTSEVTAVIIPPLSDFVKPDAKPGISDKEYQSLPENVKQIRAEARSCYQRAQFLFARIALNDSPEQRLNMALQLLDDYDDNRRLMAEVQHFLDKGIVVPKPALIEKLKPVDQLSVKELTAERQNLRTYITKDKKKINAVPIHTPRFEALRLRILHRQERLKLIDRRLNA
jgi:hypothetical protein